MRNNTSSKPGFIFVLFLWINIIIITTMFSQPISAAKKRQLPQPCERFVLYYHDIMFLDKNAANATSANITYESGVGDHKLGKLVIFDDKMTYDNKLGYHEAARAYGLYVYDMKNTWGAWFGFTIVFNSTDHKGSLSIVGNDPLMVKTRDLSVVGGTEDFFMARGIVTLETDGFEMGFRYFRLKMDIKLYECYY